MNLIFEIDSVDIVLCGIDLLEKFITQPNSFAIHSSLFCVWTCLLMQINLLLNPLLK